MPAFAAAWTHTAIQAGLATLAGAQERSRRAVYALSVPLVVDVGVGGNWREAH